MAQHQLNKRIMPTILNYTTFFSDVVALYGLLHFMTFSRDDVGANDGTSYEVSIAYIILFGGLIIYILLLLTRYVVDVSDQNTAKIMSVIRNE